MIEFPYDTSYDPALPVCDVVLSAQSTGRQVQVKAILDTGADGTIVPLRYDEFVLGRDVLNELRLLLDGPAELTRLLSDVE